LVVSPNLAPRVLISSLRSHQSIGNNLLQFFQFLIGGSQVISAKITSLRQTPQKLEAPK
jgi:hypothetical protein